MVNKQKKNSIDPGLAIANLVKAGGVLSFRGAKKLIGYTDFPNKKELDNAFGKLTANKPKYIKNEIDKEIDNEQIASKKTYMKNENTLLDYVKILKKNNAATDAYFDNYLKQLGIDKSELAEKLKDKDSEKKDLDAYIEKICNEKKARTNDTTTDLEESYAKIGSGEYQKLDWEPYKYQDEGFRKMHLRVLRDNSGNIIEMKCKPKNAKDSGLMVKEFVKERDKQQGGMKHKITLQVPKNISPKDQHKHAQEMISEIARHPGAKVDYSAIDLKDSKDKKISKKTNEMIESGEQLNKAIDDVEKAEQEYDDKVNEIVAKLVKGGSTEADVVQAMDDLQKEIAKLQSTDKEHQQRDEDHLRNCFETSTFEHEEKKESDIPNMDVEDVKEELEIARQDIAASKSDDDDGTHEKELEAIKKGLLHSLNSLRGDDFAKRAGEKFKSAERQKLETTPEKTFLELSRERLGIRTEEDKKKLKAKPVSPDYKEGVEKHLHDRPVKGLNYTAEKIRTIKERTDAKREYNKANAEFKTLFEDGVIQARAERKRLQSNFDNKVEQQTQEEKNQYTGSFLEAPSKSLKKKLLESAEFKALEKANGSLFVANKAYIKAGGEYDAEDSGRLMDKTKGGRGGMYFDRVLKDAIEFDYAWDKDPEHKETLLNDCLYHTIGYKINSSDVYNEGHKAAAAFMSDMSEFDSVHKPKGELSEVQAAQEERLEAALREEGDPKLATSSPQAPGIGAEVASELSTDPPSGSPMRSDSLLGMALGPALPRPGSSSNEKDDKLEQEDPALASPSPMGSG